MSISRQVEPRFDTAAPRYGSGRVHVSLTVVGAALERCRAIDPRLYPALLDVASDAQAVRTLAEAVMAPSRTPDGSPLLTSQAAAVLALYAQLAAAVEALAPGRRAVLLASLADATSLLDPKVVLQLLAGDAASTPDAVHLRQELAGALDETQIARVLSSTLAAGGSLTRRFASVLHTLAPDALRRRRIVALAKVGLARTAAVRAANFDASWRSVEDHLLGAGSPPLVTRRSGNADAAEPRSEAGGLPGELRDLVRTLERENIRRLSVTLLVDLLALDTETDRACELAREAAALSRQMLVACEPEFEPEAGRPAILAGARP